MFASHRQKENIPLLAMGKRATNEGKKSRVGRLLVPCDIATCVQEVLSAFCNRLALPCLWWQLDKSHQLGRAIWICSPLNSAERRAVLAGYLGQF